MVCAVRRTSLARSRYFVARMVSSVTSRILLVHCHVSALRISAARVGNYLSVSEQPIINLRCHAPTLNFLPNNGGGCPHRGALYCVIAWRKRPKRRQHWPSRNSEKPSNV